MDDNDENIIQLHLPRLTGAQSADVEDVVKATDALLRAVDRLTQEAATNSMDAARNVVLLRQLKGVIADTLSRYVLALSETGETRCFRERMERLIDALAPQR